MGVFHHLLQQQLVGRDIDRDGEPGVLAAAKGDGIPLVEVNGNHVGAAAAAQLRLPKGAVALSATGPGEHRRCRQAGWPLLRETPPAGPRESGR